MTTILSEVIRERDKLVKNGEVSDSIFLSKASLEKLVTQAAVAYDVQPESIRRGFLKMQLFPADQYRGETFRIYCKPHFDRDKLGGI